jgi:hypothetical protein
MNVVVKLLMQKLNKSTTIKKQGWRAKKEFVLIGVATPNLADTMLSQLVRDVLQIAKPKKEKQYWR